MGGHTGGRRGISGEMEGVKWGKEGVWRGLEGVCFGGAYGGCDVAVSIILLLRLFLFTRAVQAARRPLCSHTHPRLARATRALPRPSPQRPCDAGTAHAVRCKRICSKCHHTAASSVCHKGRTYAEELREPLQAADAHEQPTILRGCNLQRLRRGCRAEHLSAAVPHEDAAVLGRGHLWRV